jgi:hypothetical protein
MRFIAWTLLIVTLGCLPAPEAFAGFRCQTELVRRGMTPLEVLERCGAPEYELGWTDFRYPGLFVRVDEWTYDLGRNKFRRQLTFENGRLIRIETRGKPGGGFNPATTSGTTVPSLAPWYESPSPESR